MEKRRDSLVDWMVRKSENSEQKASEIVKEWTHSGPLGLSLQEAIDLLGLKTLQKRVWSTKTKTCIYPLINSKTEEVEEVSSHVRLRDTWLLFENDIPQTSLETLDFANPEF